MLPEALRDLIYGSSGVDQGISTNYGPGIICQLGAFPLGRVVGLTCLGLSWGMYLQMISKKPFDVNDKKLTKKMLWKSQLDFKLPVISRWLATEHRDLNHFSRNLIKYGYAPYPLITMYDNRLGESEWYYTEIDSPSHTVTWGHVNDVYQEGKDSLEFEFFRKALRVCGRFPKHHMRKMFAHCKIFELEKNEVLMAVGDIDENMIIILDGEVKITTVSTTGLIDVLRIAKTGDKLLSLFSFIDALTGHIQPIKTIEAFATKPSKILKFPLVVFKNYLLLHKKKILDVVKRLIRKIYDINSKLLDQTLGILDSLTPDHLRFGSSSKYMKLLPSNPHELPDPVTEGISDEMREEAIRDLMRFLGVPEDNYSQFATCPVYLLDPDPRGVNAKMPVEHYILNDKGYKFRYLYKGKADIYMIQESILYQLQHPNEVDGFLNELDDDEFLAEWERDSEKFDHAHYAYIYSGEGMGGLAAFSEQDNQLFIKLVQRSIFVMVPESLFNSVLQVYPEAAFPILHQIILRITPVMRMMDFGIEWTEVPGGVCLFATGNEVHDTYLVLSGKLRSYLVNPKGSLTFYGDYESLNWIGLIEALVMFPLRSKTVIAARNSEVVRIPMFYINFMKNKFPYAAAALLQNLAGRSESRRHASYQRQNRRLKPVGQISFGKPKFYEVFEGNSRCVSSMALLPLTDNIPVIPFALEIQKHHIGDGNTAVLTWEMCKKACKIPYINVLNEFCVQTWIMNALNENALVVFVCSSCSKRWSRMCIQFSELIVSLGVRGRTIGEHWMERKMIRDGFGFSKRKELVVLHNQFPDRRQDPRDIQGMRLHLPYDTSGFLEERPWISIHHHLRLPQEAFKPEFLDHAPIEQVKSNYTPLKRSIHEHSDMSRFNRWLTGRATGVVFTGGGARFATQIGVLKRFIEEDLAIDMVGGVGTGLIIACLYALYQNIDAVEAAVRDIFSALHEVTHSKSLRTFLFDMTIPYISPIQGKGMSELCEKYFGLARMEDAWIPIFGITTDIGKQDSRVHRNGPMWIYTRASLSNFLFGPPVNDPRDGGYIVDGSFSNPIPEDVMRNFGAEFVLVINTTLGVTYEAAKPDPAKDIFTNAWRMFVMIASKLNFVTPDFVKINDLITRTQKVMYAEAVQANTDGLFVAIIRPKVEYHAAHNYTGFDSLMWMGRDYADKIIRQLGDKTVSPNGYRQFWTRLMYINKAIEVMEGRPLHKDDFHEEFWEKLDSRIFERDDKRKGAFHGEEYVGAFADAQQGISAAPHVIHEREQNLKKQFAMKDFTDWIYTKFMKI